jgi:AcrR family transcriptional regulator
MSVTTQNRYLDSPQGLSSGALTMMNVATSAFCEKGFHGTSLRDLARAAGMSQPAMYHYFPSKHALLVAISQAAVNSLIIAVDEALADCPDEPGTKLDRLVTAHVLCEIRVRRLSFVANTEVRSLEPYARDDFETKRAYVQGIYDRILTEGAGSGVFRNPYPLETARALASMCIAVNSWYRENGALPAQAIAQRYSQLAHFAVGYTNV